MAVFPETFGEGQILNFPSLDDLSLRSKLLLTTLIPVAVASLAVLLGFRIGLNQVREDAIPRQQLVHELEANSAEYLSEIREYLFEGLPRTLEEIAEQREEMEAIAQRVLELSETSTQHTEALESIHDATQVLIAAGEQTLEARRDVLRRTPPGTRGQELTPPLASTLEDQLLQLEEAERALRKALETELRLADEELATAFEHFEFLTYGAAVLGLGLATLFALAIAQRFLRPLWALTQASRRFAAGELDQRAEPMGSDEIGTLANAFNEMAVEQERLIGELQDNLETLQRTQSQLVQSGKLSAIGELAAGVAHELNNPLSAVLTYTLLIRERHDQLPQEVRDQLPKAVQDQLPRVERQLGLVETAARRCKTVADNLLLFSRQEEDTFDPLDLEEVLERSFDLLASNLKRNGVHYRLDISDQLPSHYGNLNQLQQVVVNLVTNAQQALGEEGGHLVVSATPASNDKGGSLLTVTDDGPGIAPGDLDRLFDPFFTTKPPGQGTGLGLSITYGIVRRHGGTIDVSSTPGQGTTFSVWLPSAKASPFRRAAP